MATHTKPMGQKLRAHWYHGGVALVTAACALALSSCNEAPKRRTGGPANEGTGKLVVKLSNPPAQVSAFQVTLAGVASRADSSTGGPVTFLGLTPGTYKVSAGVETDTSASYLSSSCESNNDTVTVTAGNNDPLEVNVCKSNAADQDAKFQQSYDQAQKEQDALESVANQPTNGGSMGGVIPGSSTGTSSTVILKPKVIESSAPSTAPNTGATTTTTSGGGTSSVIVKPQVVQPK